MAVGRVVAAPLGTITFLLTDVVGSSRHWEADAAGMRAAIELHDQVVGSSVEYHRGVVLTSHGEGDSFFAVFTRAADAVAAAATIQRSLVALSWPAGIRLHVRMAVHSGEGGPDYRGPAANRCARLRACAHGSQVVLSQSAVELIDALPPGGSLRDMGVHRLRDLSRPERIFQLVLDDVPSEFPPLRSLGAASHNLPVQLTSFVGRTGELEEVRAHLARSRLVTLTGTGGCGKTRLALQVAGEELETYPGGAWFVGIGALADPALLPQAVASAIGIREAAGQAPLDWVIGHFRERPTLLVVDGCERLVSACAALAVELLGACPELRLLVTSQELLNVPGEIAWRVPSLTLPEPGPEPSIERLAHSEAVALFLDRAAAARPGFLLTLHSAIAVADVCRRLEGIPLAIELAAARLRVMSLAEMRGRLDDRFRLLTGGSRSTLDRHRTLRATVDWSYDLLDAFERLLFERLSVFTGSWSLEDAEAVCSDETVGPDQVVDLLGRLADKSLVSVADDGESTRYHLLETLREYSRERLVQSGWTGAMLERHLHHFAAAAVEADATRPGRDQPACLRRLDGGYDDFVAALETARDLDGDRLLDMAGSLAWYWGARGRLREGRRWLEAALAGGTERTWPRAQALKGLGVVRWHQRDYAAARAVLTEASGIFAEVGDELAVAWCENNLGLVAYSEQDFGRALAHYGASLPVIRRLGEPLTLAKVLGNLGQLETEIGLPERGTSQLDESLALIQEHGAPAQVAQALAYCGTNALRGGDLVAARRHLVDGLRLARELGDEIVLMSALEGLALLAAAERHPERGVRLASAAAAHRERIGARATPLAERRYERWLGPARALLSRDAMAAAEAAGARMSLDEAAAFALEVIVPEEPTRPGDEAQAVV